MRLHGMPERQNMKTNEDPLFGESMVETVVKLRIYF